ncbi:hypothetical protein BCR44DRAFT_1501197 [Catenaria anguillulae PL171]|uniref:Uncharacterized protein n=1 Tax=Catenaria anguillulae PL171 TaxID=765915 RepID=A0A1Y2HI16_9FUNG|nr:hypothetical protein BCR44DRAFT_1501197 [Catenaria anguillulae PL171]
MPRSTGTGKCSPENLTGTTIEARLDKVVVSPATNSVQCSIHFTSPNLAAPAWVQVDIGLDAIQHAFKTPPTPGSTMAAILPVAFQCPHPHPPPLTPSTATSTLPTVTPTNDITRTNPNPETARALRFIQFYTDDTGHQPRVHILADRQYYFDAEQIAAFYSPNLKHPRDAVKRHLSRWIGCSDSEANGIRLVGKTVVGTIDALLDKLVAKMRSTRKDVAF